MFFFLYICFNVFIILQGFNETCCAKAKPLISIVGIMLHRDVSRSKQRFVFWNVAVVCCDGSGSSLIETPIIPAPAPCREEMALPPSYELLCQLSICHDGEQPQDPPPAGCLVNRWTWHPRSIRGGWCLSGVLVLD